MNTAMEINIPVLFRKNMIGMIVAAIMTILGIVIDGIVVARFLGTEAMAAYGLVTPVTNLFMMFSGMISTGAQVVCAEHIGAGRNERAREVFSMCMVITLVLSAILMAVLFFFRSGVCVLLGAGSSGAVFQHLSDYILGLLFSVPSVLLLLEYNGLMRLDGDPNRIIYAVIAMIVLDVSGDLLNAFVLNWGMLGMGVTTSISYAVSVVIMLFHFRRRDIIFRFRLKGLKASDMRDILVTGSPSAVGSASSALRNRVLNAVMLGTASAVAATAALSVHYTILGFTSTIMLGIGMTCSMIAGMISGRGNRDEATLLIKTAAKYALSVGVIITVLLLLFAPAITGLFGSAAETEMISLAERGLRIYACGYILYSINTLFNSYMQGMRLMAVSNVFCFLENFVFISLAALALAQPLRTDAVWFAFLITEILTFLSVIIYAAVKKKGFPGKLSDFAFMREKSDS